MLLPRFPDSVERKWGEILAYTQMTEEWWDNFQTL